MNYHLKCKAGFVESFQWSWIVESFSWSILESRGHAFKGAMPPAAAGLIILPGIGVWVAGCYQYLMGKAQRVWKAI